MTSTFDTPIIVREFIICSWKLTHVPTILLKMRIIFHLNLEYTIYRKITHEGNNWHATLTPRAKFSRLGEVFTYITILLKINSCKYFEILNNTRKKEAHNQVFIGEITAFTPTQEERCACFVDIINLVPPWCVTKEIDQTGPHNLQMNDSTDNVLLARWS